MKLFHIPLGLLLCLPIIAWAQVGEVRFAQGDVRIEHINGKQEALVRGMKLSEGDTIITGQNAYAQLHMADQGILAVRANTVLKLSTYRFTQQGGADDSAILNLIRGGFRSITGLIGRKHKNTYSIRTPSATIGIRGTDHETVFIPPPTPSSTPDIQPPGTPGTYNVVHSGATFIETAGGRVELLPNQSGFAPINSQQSPVRLAQTPPFLRQTTPVRPVNTPQGGQATERETSTDANTTALPPPPPPSEPTPAPVNSTNTSSADGVLAPLPTAPLLPPPEEGTLDLRNPPAGSQPAPIGTALAGGDLTNGMVSSGAAYTGNPQDSLGAVVDSNGHLLALTGNNFQYNSDGAARVFEGGADIGGQTIKWGIYAGGTLQDNGNINTPQFFHYMIGGTVSTETSLLSAMPNAGSTLTMSTVYGYTKPITEGGQFGGTVNGINIVLKNVGASFSVANYYLSVTDAAGRDWSASMPNPISLPMFVDGGSSNLSVSCSGCPPGVTSGKAGGVVIGNPVSAIISSYSLQAGSAGVTGTVLAK